MTTELSRLVATYEASPESGDHYHDLIRFAKEKIGSEDENGQDQHIYVKALADAARSETGRKAIVDSDIVNHVGGCESG